MQKSHNTGRSLEGIMNKAGIKDAKYSFRGVCKACRREEYAKNADSIEGRRREAYAKQKLECPELVKKRCSEHYVTIRESVISRYQRNKLDPEWQKKEIERRKKNLINPPKPLKLTCPHCQVDFIRSEWYVRGKVRNGAKTCFAR